MIFKFEITVLKYGKDSNFEFNIVFNNVTRFYAISYYPSTLNRSGKNMRLQIYVGSMQKS